MPMLKSKRHSLIFGLSCALDIAGKNNLSHSKSTAYLSVLIGREMGLAAEDILNLYYAALLHDIGVSNAYIFNEHCAIGEKMLKKLPISPKIPLYVRYHHEYIDGTGVFGLAGSEIPLISQIIGIASAFDDMFGRTAKFDSGVYSKIGSWQQLNNNLFAADIIRAFAGLIKQEFFLLDYFNHETKYTLSQKVVVDDDVYFSYREIQKFAGCFADIIDRRSPFTFNHSTGIAKLAQKATVFLGYDEETQNKMYIAGLLHDVGKLHVSSEILHKNGKLLPEERFEINKHTYFTRKILEQIDGFEDIVNYAANHHEKLDGSGYPYHINADNLSELDRLMAICDVYQALTEERPYRPVLPAEKVWEIIDKMAQSNHLDKSLVSKLKQLF